MMIRLGLLELLVIAFIAGTLVAIHNDLEYIGLQLNALVRK